MNTYPGLTWEFHEPTDKVDFMDLTISISKGQISTSLYEKPLNLHLYIRPHSAHPPGLLPGIVHSTLFRIYTLCSDNDDKLTRTKVFFKRLVARGYKSDQIKPLFYKAITHAKLYSGPIDRTANDDTSVILHLPFHPNDPPPPPPPPPTKFKRSGEIQLHHQNTICHYRTCETPNHGKNAIFNA